jgi:hypothetical protein
LQNRTNWKTRHIANLQTTTNTTVPRVKMLQIATTRI